MSKRRTWNEEVAAIHGLINGMRTGRDARETLLIITARIGRLRGFERFRAGKNQQARIERVSGELEAMARGRARDILEEAALRADSLKLIKAARTPDSTGTSPPWAGDFIWARLGQMRRSKEGIPRRPAVDGEDTQDRD
jgi:hypothetical protein